MSTTDSYSGQVLNTKLTAIGTPAVALTPHGVLLAYCSGDPTMTIVFDQAKYGSTGLEPFQPTLTGLRGFIAGNASETLSVNGVALEIMPGGDTGFIAFVNGAQQMQVNALTVSNGQWAVGKAMAIYSNSRCFSPPGLMMGLQNGQPVLNISWYDGVGSLVLAQLEIYNSAPLLTFRALGETSYGAPSITCAGTRSFFAWSGTNAQLNLAVDPLGGVNFDFKNKVTFTGLTTAYGSQFVPFGSQMGYLVWGAQGGMAPTFQQVALDAAGNWSANGLPGCSGRIQGALPVGSGVFAHADRYNDGSDNGLPAISMAYVNWGNPSQVCLVSFQANLSPIPLSQLQITQ